MINTMFLQISQSVFHFPLEKPFLVIHKLLISTLFLLITSRFFVYNLKAFPLITASM